jgi:hypothetical protein
LLEISSFFTVKLKMFLNLNHHHIIIVISYALGKG